MRKPRPRIFRPAGPALGLLLALAIAVLAMAAPTCAAERQLVFGMSAAFSGPARGLGQEYYQGLAASFAQTNAQGGAGGWRLVLSVRDDGYDPVPTQANTIGFVEQERVFALLGYVGTPTTVRVLPLLRRYEAERMVLLFPLTGSDMLREPDASGLVFNLRASYLDETRGLVEALLATGRRRIAVFYQADAYGRNGWDGVRRALRRHGLDIVSEAGYRRGAAYTHDFRREVGLLQAAAPDAVITAGTAASCAAFIRDARNAGLTFPIATLSFADADNLVKFLLAQQRVTGRDYAAGLIFSQVVPNHGDLSLPAVRGYRQALAGPRPALPTRLTSEDYVLNNGSFASFEGYLAGQVLAEAVRRMADAPSRQRLAEVLRGMRGLDVGVGTPVGFAPGGVMGLGRTYLTTWRQGRFESWPAPAEARP